MIRVYGCHTVYKNGQEIVQLSLRGSIPLAVESPTWRRSLPEGKAVQGPFVGHNPDLFGRAWLATVTTLQGRSRHFDLFSYRFVIRPVSN